MAKSPSFQFYPRDHISDERVRLLSPAEEGVLLRLYCIQWLEGSIPADMAQLAALCRVRVNHMKLYWRRLESFYVPSSVSVRRLINPRLEAEREAQQARSAERQETGRRGVTERWDQQAQRAAQLIQEPPQPDSLAQLEDEASSATSPASTSANTSASPELLPKGIANDSTASATATAITTTPPTPPSGPATAPAERESVAVGVVHRNGKPPPRSSPASPRGLEAIKAHLAQALAGVAAQADRRVRADDLRELKAELVFAYWAAKHKHPGSLLDPARTRRIGQRLAENGDDVHELLYAVDGALKDEWLMGRDRQSTRKYDGIEHLFRDRSQVERLAALAPGHVRRDPHPLAVKYLEAATVPETAAAEAD